MTRFVVTLAAALALTSCGISDNVYMRDINRMKDDVAAANEERDAELRARQACQKELQAQSSRTTLTDQELQRTLVRVDQLERISERQKQVVERLRQELDKFVQAGQLKVDVIHGQFTVSIGEKLLFPSGKAKLKGSARDALREVAQILASVPDRHYQVAGHTDNVGNDKFNWKLSGDRARAVMDFLVNHGMPENRISYAGFGEHLPAAPNDTHEGRAENRRVEVVLVPDMEEIMAVVEQVPGRPPQPTPAR